MTANKGLLLRLRKWLEKRIRPTSYIGMAVYNVYYNLRARRGEYYVFRRYKGAYLGTVKTSLGRFELILPSKSAVVFVYECFILRMYEQGVKIPRGSVVVDVGANVGIFTVYAAARVGPRGKVIAIEPSSENVDVLRKNLELNDIENAVVIHAGASATDQTLKLFLAQESFCNSFIEEPEQYTGRSERVRVRPLDDLLLETGTDRGAVRFIKIDVEGAEMDVLVGASRTILAKPLAIILPDIRPREMMYRESIDFLRQRGFKATGQARGIRATRR